MAILCANHIICTFLLMIAQLFICIDADEIHIKLDHLSIDHLQRLEFYFSVEDCSELTAARQLKAVFMLPICYNQSATDKIRFIRIEVDQVKDGNNAIVKFSEETVSGKTIAGTKVKVNSKIRCIWVQVFAIRERIDAANLFPSRKFVKLDIENDGKKFCLEFDDTNKVYVLSFLLPNSTCWRFYCLVSAAQQRYFYSIAQ